VNFIRTDQGHHARGGHDGLIWGFEPICRDLSFEHALPIAPSTHEHVTGDRLHRRSDHRTWLDGLPLASRLT